MSVMSTDLLSQCRDATVGEAAAPRATYSISTRSNANSTVSITTPPSTARNGE